MGEIPCAAIVALCCFFPSWGSRGAASRVRVRPRPSHVKQRNHTSSVGEEERLKAGLRSVLGEAGEA